MPSKLNVERKKISDLTPDPSNANAGTERGLSMLDDSLSVVGLGRSIVTDKNGIIIGGNKTTERALDRGFENAIVVHTNGDELVVVQRDDLDLGANTPDNPARKLAYYDNRVAQVDLQWDAEQLLADVNAGFDFEHLFSEGELAALLAGLDTGSAGEDPGAQVDRAAELQQKWNTERGQLWAIGKHRLLCGDSTSTEDVARLMGDEKADIVFTDPPYNIDYEGVKDKRDKIANDKQSEEGFVSFLKQALLRCEKIYVCCSWQFAHLFKQAMSEIGMPPKAMIVWDKVNPAQHLDKYYKQHELIYYYGEFGGERTLRGDVWQIKRQSNEFHPTTKPVELVTMALEDNPTSVTVYDPFGGSGTTMVACEQLGRQCRMMELEPKYCAVILERMTGMGITPELQA